MSTEELTGAATWTAPSWRGPALAWAAEQLAERGVATAGEPEQVHVRAWSTAVRIPTDDGAAVWLKSVGVGSAQEPVLARALGERAPDRVLVPLAVDVPRRLVLLPDGGTTLRASGRGHAPEAWEAMLGDYARLQIAVADAADDLVALGVPDNRPHRLPALVGDLLADDAAMLVGTPDGLDPAVRARLVASLDGYAELCALLAGGPVPPTVQHDDLHDGNVFVVDGGHRFFDWGDASVAHPFLSLTVALRMASRALGLPAGSPVLVRLRDAYLGPWGDLADADLLRELVRIALRVTPLQRALTWHRILSGVHPDERAEWQDSVPGWAAESLEPGPLAGVAGA